MWWIGDCLPCTATRQVTLSTISWLCYRKLLSMQNCVQISVDMMKLNKCVVRSTYPLPLFDKQFQRFHLSRFITTLDATNGYWQTPLAENDQIWTTFMTPWGRFKLHGYLRPWFYMATSLGCKCGFLRRRHSTEGSG